LNGEVKDHFCMVFGSRLHRFEYPFEGCTPIVVGKYSSSHEQEGPDLTFIRLNNPLKLQTIKSSKSFYPLNTAKGEVIDEIPINRCPWLVSGTPGEKCSISATETGEPFAKIAQFVGFGQFLQKFGRDDFDYVKIRVPSGSHNYPARYGGVSGGGVWIPFSPSEDPEGKVLKPALSLLLAGSPIIKSKKRRTT